MLEGTPRKEELAPFSDVVAKDRCDRFVMSMFTFQNVTVVVNSAVALPPPYATSECRMPGFLVISDGVFQALKRSVLFQIPLIQTLGFCCYLLTRTRDLVKAMYVKLCSS